MIRLCLNGIAQAAVAVALPLLLASGCSPTLSDSNSQAAHDSPAQKKTLPPDDQAIEAGDASEGLTEANDPGADVDTPAGVKPSETEQQDLAPSVEDKILSAETDKPIVRAISYLFSQQSEDGGIKSDAYGVLRPGAATTALVLYALSHVPEENRLPYQAEVARACEFIQRGIAKTGTVAAPDGTFDYPSYGAAMMLVADRKMKLELSDAERERLRTWVLNGQLTQRHEVSKDSIQYGGWDLEATSGAKGEQLKGSNISITSFALEALSSLENDEAQAAIERAKGWVQRCQNDDGGFVFHTWRTHPGNKAMWSDENQQNAVPYGTPTCDGLRCLMYCRFDKESKSVQAARRWISSHPDAKFVSGFQGKAREYGWSEGLRFYYYFTQAKVLPYLPKAEARRRANVIRKTLLAEQQIDGSFINSHHRMFEDDPLLATGLAVIALALSNEEDLTDR